MPSVDMFKAETDAEFFFIDDRLFCVEIDFKPLPNQEPEEMVQTIADHLKGAYTFTHRSEDTNISGAYTLHYSGNGTDASLWVNFRKSTQRLTLLDKSAREERSRMLKKRENEAFGVKMEK